MSPALTQLYESISQRKRPEDVAELILATMGEKLSPREKNKLEKAAQGSLRRTWGYSSMGQRFFKPVGAEKQISKAVELFKLVPVAKETYDDPRGIAQFIASTSLLIGKQYGQSHFFKHRLNKLQRQEAGLDLSKRQYNKRFRLMKRLEGKLAQFTQEQQKAEFGQLAKHGLAHHLTWEEFSQDENTACFIAYYTARCNLRSQFTIDGQERAYDDIADVLFDRCLGEIAQERSFWAKLTGALEQRLENNTTNWWAIAHVYSHPRVLVNLTEEEKGKLLGRWTAALEEIALMLKSIYEKSRINRETMVVRKGNDSSTWNATAGAWNKARDSWMNLIYSMDLESILDQMCFGKVLRLMAGDIAAWHRMSGGGLDANTVVWNELPLPWQVFSGKAVCTRAMVERACRKAGLDAQKSGWIAPRPHGVVSFKPTPELVHGVSIANPFLANVLKQHHYFSGKANVKPFNPQYN